MHPPPQETPPWGGLAAAQPTLRFGEARVDGPKADPQINSSGRGKCRGPNPTFRAGRADARPAQRWLGYGFCFMLLSFNFWMPMGSIIEEIVPAFMSR